ncbi:MAG: hypothetical protein L3J57_14280 [Desulfuromusa sp.]|nr:hypothetical protein [Desulfuromusa sp.]
MVIKQVWGFVLIVLGVVAFISGIQILSDINSLDMIVSDFPFVQSSGVQSLDNILINAQNEYINASRYAKFSGAFRIVLGIVLSLWGTMLFKKETTVNSDHFDNLDNPEDINKYDGFKME